MTKYFRALNNDVNFQVDAFVEMLQTFFQLDIVAIYLLGSHTDNTAVSTSDVDIAVIYRGSNPEYIKKVNSFFTAHSRELFKYEIDLYLIELKRLS